MSVASVMSEDGSEVTISLSGRFDFNTHNEFRRAYTEVDGHPARYVLDMAGTEHMDSSALGMLLQLRNHAQSKQAEIILKNCNQAILEILRISNFHKLFKIAELE